MMYSTSYSSEPIPGRLNLEVQLSDLPHYALLRRSLGETSFVVFCAVVSNLEKDCIICFDGIRDASLVKPCLCCLVSCFCLKL